MFDESQLNLMVERTGPRRSSSRLGNRPASLPWQPEVEAEDPVGKNVPPYWARSEWGTTREREEHLEAQGEGFLQEAFNVSQKSEGSRMGKAVCLATTEAVCFFREHLL